MEMFIDIYAIFYLVLLSEVKHHYLCALSHLLQWVPKQVLLTELPTVSCRLFSASLVLLRALGLRGFSLCSYKPKIIACSPFSFFFLETDGSHETNWSFA